MTAEFTKRLDELSRAVSRKLEDYMTNVLAGTKGQRKVAEAMGYSLSAGGKRIRPVLAAEFCRICGGDAEAALPAACALEMIHTFSLIHDDLPAMDNDDFRRGKPSCHKAFGEAAAILAGDALSVLPFEIIADDSLLTDTQKIRIISVLAKSVGKSGMIGGQVIDMENEERSDVDEENLRNMYRRKTGELIAVSCMMGCICAGADDEAVAAASEYGCRLGLAFQIIDDILDVTSTAEELGKPIGSDSQENKTTFVTLYGVEKAQEIAGNITDEAMLLLEKFGNNQFLKELTSMLLKRKN